MLSALFSRLIILVCGTLYPAYASHKAVKTKNVKEYVKWMMYWIIFALYTFVEIFTDIFVAFWMPFYYELKIIFVIWLTCPLTKGSSYLYRKVVHPYLQLHEAQLDAYLDRLWENGIEFCQQLGSHGFSYLVELVVEILKKGQTVISTKFPALMELAEETSRTSSTGGNLLHVAGYSNEGSTADFEDYDVVQPHEVNASGLSSDVGHIGQLHSMHSAISRVMGGSSDGEISSVESRPLRLRSAHVPTKHIISEDDASVPVVKSEKVKHRRNAKK